MKHLEDTTKTTTTTTTTNDSSTSSMNEQQQQQWITPTAEPSQKQALLYQPIIRAYNCQGAFSIRSNSSSSKNKSNSTTGVCRGIQTQYEHLQTTSSSRKAARATTRDGAIQDFTQSVLSALDEMLEDPKATIFVPPVPPQEQEQQTQASSKTQQQQQQQQLNEQSMFSIGSTDVQYLVLKNKESGEEHVAAVAPQKYFGFALTDVKDKQTNKGTRTFDNLLGLFLIEIDYKLDKNKDKETKIDKKTEHKPSSSPVVPPPQQQRLQRHETVLPAASSAASATAAQSISPLPPPDLFTNANARKAMDSVYKAGLYYVNFSCLVGKHMQYNTKWIQDNVFHGDVPLKTFEYSKKILWNVQPTTERAANFFTKTVKKTFGSTGSLDSFFSNNNNNNNNNASTSMSSSSGNNHKKG